MEETKKYLKNYVNIKHQGKKSWISSSLNMWDNTLIDDFFFHLTEYGLVNTLPHQQSPKKRLQYQLTRNKIWKTEKITEEYAYSTSHTQYTLIF